MQIKSFALVAVLVLSLGLFMLGLARPAYALARVEVDFTGRCFESGFEVVCPSGVGDPAPPGIEIEWCHLISASVFVCGEADPFYRDARDYYRPKGEDEFDPPQKDTSSSSTHPSENTPEDLPPVCDKKPDLPQCN